MIVKKMVIGWTIFFHLIYLYMQSEHPNYLSILLLSITTLKYFFPPIARENKVVKTRECVVVNTTRKGHKAGNKKDTRILDPSNVTMVLG